MYMVLLNISYFKFLHEHFFIAIPSRNSLLTCVFTLHESCNNNTMCMQYACRYQCKVHEWIIMLLKILIYGAQ